MSETACKQAVDWACQYDSFEEAWNECPRGDWMAKFLLMHNFPKDKVLGLVVQTSLLVPTLANYLHVDLDKTWFEGPRAVRRLCRATGMSLELVADDLRRKFSFREVWGEVQNRVARQWSENEHP
jgi:hypothetical protein